jgi:hypothetical protein
MLSNKQTTIATTMGEECLKISGEFINQPYKHIPRSKEAKIPKASGLDFDKGIW